MKYIPVAEWAIEKQRSKKVKIAGMGDYQKPSIADYKISKRVYVYRLVTRSYLTDLNAEKKKVVHVLRHIVVWRCHGWSCAII